VTVLRHDVSLLRQKFNAAAVQLILSLKHHTHPLILFVTQANVCISF